MSRAGVGGLVGALVALCPVIAAAEPAPAGAGADGPKVSAEVGPSPSFKFYAGASIDDIARTTNVPEMLVRIGLRDPAAEISLDVAKDLAQRKNGSIVASGPADYTVTVTSTEWSAGYYVPHRGTFNLRYSADLTVTDASGKVVKKSACQVMPDDDNSAGGNDMLIAHGGRKLKEIYAKATESCRRTLISKTKSL